MSISDNNKRTTLTYPKDLYAKLEEWAKEDNRSVNNLVIYVLREYEKQRMNNDKQ